ncbi:MAG: hypothetical protein ACRD0Z_16780 [Acidimicrobiales bacterium]
MEARPPTLASERLLSTTLALQEILPGRGLQRGTTVLIEPGAASGSTTLALEMLAGVSVGGYWCAVAGAPELGLVAASERGIDLGRLLLVPSLGAADRWPQVVATLFDAVDVVLFVPPPAVRPSDARRLSARSKERGSVLVVLDRKKSWSGPSDLRCTVTRSEWAGLSKGYGLLRERGYEVEVSGRGAAARPLRAPLRLPA